MTDNKFGLFIHWGLYSYFKVQDQVFVRFDMDREKYEDAINHFNPVLYDPEKWVLEAKKAGMKYVCFTTKHHDGFCMWDTKFTDYNIMNTPYGKDVLKALSEACKKHGIKLSLYYSNPDWNYEYGFNPQGTFQWKAKNKECPDFDRYKQYIKNQITELLTNYGEIYTLFWDIPPRVEDESINELVRKLQPNIYINDRGFSKGDFATPERDYEDEEGCNRFERMTEACNSIGEQSWGYREEEDYHSIRYLTMSIDKIMARGGSYLLNIGPKPDGTFSDVAVEMLAKVGDWYQRMEGCLEGTEEDSYEYEVKKHKFIVNKKNGKSYFHFYEGICSSAICFEKYPNVPKSVHLMNTGKQLSFKRELMPEYFVFDTGRAIEMLHISGIPIDTLEHEPIVLEIEW